MFHQTDIVRAMIFNGDTLLAVGIRSRQLQQKIGLNKFRFEGLAAAHSRSSLKKRIWFNSTVSESDARRQQGTARICILSTDEDLGYGRFTRLIVPANVLS